MASRSFAQHLDPAVCPKCIRALDAAGPRGVTSLAILTMDALAGCHPGAAPRLCDQRCNLPFEPAWSKDRI